MPSMPGGGGTGGVASVPGAIGAMGISPVGRFLPNPTPLSRYNISGVTRDSVGSPLGLCTVEVFETVSGLLRGSTVSDANGNYSLDVTGGLTFFLVAYKPGSPDVSGTTVNTLVGT